MAFGRAQSPLILAGAQDGLSMFQVEGQSSDVDGYTLRWNTLLFPACVAVVSALILLLHVLVVFFKHLKPSLSETSPSASSESASRTDSSNLSVKLRLHVANHGGYTIFAYKLARLLGCFALLGLSLWSSSAAYDNIRFTNNSPQLAMCSAYLYFFVLALVSVSAPLRWSKVATTHLSLLLLFTLGIYIYRDLYPLVTFTLTPKDASEGALLWTKISVLVFTAIVVPVAMPRQYVPVDPKNPMSEPNPEQTASIFSLVFYFFMDHIILLAYGVTHLEHDQLPPLADYDSAENLKIRAFPHLDAYHDTKRRHLFFRLMRVFGREYSMLALMQIVRMVCTFASPLGVNRLLRYLETHGEGAIIRPWFWIAILFIGPIVGSLAFQWYIFITTGTLVRTESLITQLVFEHSLRIRIKAETSVSGFGSGSRTPSTSSNNNTGDNSRAESPNEENEVISSSSTSTEGDETLQVSSATVKSTSSKADTKSVSASSATVVSPGAKGHPTSGNLIGKINNLVTTDLGNIVEGRDFLVVLLQIPLQLVLCIAFLYALLGYSAFVGLAFLLCLFPVPGYVAKLIQKVQVTRMEKTDGRVQTVTEIMGLLRMIKFFGWEGKINTRISEKREEELTWIKKYKILETLNGTFNFIISLGTMIVTYTTYTVVMKQDLTASIVFGSLTVFNMLQMQLQMALRMVTACIQGKVSLDRVNDFLNDTELLDSFSDKPEVAELFGDAPQGSQDLIGFRDASFTWSTETDGSLTPSRRNFILRIEDELLFKRGALNLVVGPTGSGKTSLLMGLLGEMHFIPSTPKSWFNLPRKDGIAYAAQESWVLNETIKENILFGSPYDEERYKKVLYQCCLERDLSLFEAGDQTEVGEKGLSISGGQKARITLARAIYSKAGILLLDDVFAALDVHTARWIVDKCFSGDLIKGRTIILVTHNIALVRPIAQFIVGLVDGRIAESGSIEDTLAKDAVLSAELAKDQELLDEADTDLPITVEAAPADGKLIMAEEVAVGHISWPALKLYLSALGGKHPVLFFLAFEGSMVATYAIFSTQTWFLGYWASQYETHPASEVHVFFYITVYVCILLSTIIASVATTVIYLFGSLRASRTIHKYLIESVLGTTLRWLDVTPTSRVIARCTQDIRATDGPLAQCFNWIVELSTALLSKLVAIVIFTPVFVFPGIIVFVAGALCGQLYMRAQLCVKREMSNAKSPVLAHFGAAIAGLTSLRAYGAQEKFTTETQGRINRYTRAARTYYNLNRWVSMRIDTFGGLFSASLAAYLVYGRVQSASNIGFSLNMAVTFAAGILDWVRILNEVEVQGNSLERIKAYMDIEHEPKPTEDGVPPAYWPSSGDIRVENLSARYSADGPKVLQDISFHIKSGERVGVVGRTGSGKSSLTLSLLRCIVTEGVVYYDGIPTNSLNLDALRSNITIIPQVPELLSGTLRQNLDPFSQYDDATLNAALRAAGLVSLQSEMDDGQITLDSSIASGGANLSVGQRQILALARAIVRQSKLLILDEATSAIDYKTDAVIQSSLRDELSADVTVITVAHRLQTIMDADKIMVLDAGHIVEFDSPKELLRNPHGRLRALVDESGDKDTLIAMAERQ